MQNRKKKKVLLLGAISPFCDLVKEIDQLNIEPIICDYYSDAPAKKMGFKSYNISTTDTKALLNLAYEEKIDGIICAFSDRNLLPAYFICEKLNLRYFNNREIIECLTDKKIMKNFFSANGYPVVKYGVIDSENLDTITGYYDFPIVTKPIDAYGSKGIFLCENPEDIKSSFEKTIRESLKYKNKFIVEEFYDADEVSISAWVKEGKAYITCVYDVFRNIENSFTLSAVSFPSKYTEKELNHFNQLINCIVSDIGIIEGPITLQCFIGEKGIKISELLCRLAGGSPYLYPIYIGGPNIARMVIEYSIYDLVDYQNLIDFKPSIQSNEVYYDIQILINHKGKIHYNFNKNTIINSTSEVEDFIIYYKDGHEIINVGDNGAVFAKIICRVERNQDYYKLIEKLQNLITVYDDKGKIISCIRKPVKLNVVDCYPINWDFLSRKISNSQL